MTEPRPRTAAATPVSEAYVQGHIDRYHRDRESDVLCRNCGQPWAEKMLTLGEAAARLGVAASTLRVQIRNGKLKARKMGRDWTVSEREVERYRRDSKK